MVLAPRGGLGGHEVHRLLENVRHGGGLIFSLDGNDELSDSLAVDAGMYAALFEPLGYAITTFLVFSSGCWFLDRKHMKRDLIIAFIASFVLYFVFSLVLRVNLPAGPLRLLGI